jgi:outer membrane protein assembly factor BamD (BamD/ComL family)
MIKYVLIILALAGGYYYAGGHVGLDKALVYAEQHKGASWAPQARYYISVYYQQSEQYRKSQPAFSQMLTDYPTGPHASRSLLYLAEAAEQNLDWETARMALDRYMADFPNGPDIQLITTRRESLRNKHGI